MWNKDHYLIMTLWNIDNVRFPSHLVGSKFSNLQPKMLNHIYKAIGNILGEPKELDDISDPLDFESGLFLDCAIYWVQVSNKLFKRILVIFIYISFLFKEFKKLLLPRECRTLPRGRCPATCNMKCNTCKTCKSCKT